MYYRHFFPSTETEVDEDWEEVEGGESAENGPKDKKPETEATDAVEDTSSITLPDVPSGEPKEDGPAVKKQKPNDEEKL